jgi:hypothetical protein
VLSLVSGDRHPFGRTGSFSDADICGWCGDHYLLSMSDAHDGIQGLSR